MKNFLLVAGIVLLISAEIIHALFLMPVPAVQKIHVVELVYFFYHNIVIIRIIAWVCIAYPAAYILLRAKTWKKIVLAVAAILYATLFYYMNMYFVASDVYQQPRKKTFVTRSENKIEPDKVVIGVTMNGEAKAYPIQLLGYHHLVRDTFGSIPVLITYCTLCRTGRVYNATINGRPGDFTLIGLNRNNAVVQDYTTKSWWQQATGSAIAGPMKGATLAEIPFQQVKLSTWLKKYPTSRIMQPDSFYAPRYAVLEDFDRGPFYGRPAQTDSDTYKAKSLVVGVTYNNTSKSFDWNKLSYFRAMEDTLSGLPLLITLEPDNASFHAWSRDVNGQTLDFNTAADKTKMTDTKTASVWNMQGTCIEGPLQGKQLQEIQAYQETRESWEDFYPAAE